MTDPESSARKVVLEDLLSLRGSLDEVLERLASFQWDSPEELATLNRSEALDLVTRFLTDTVPSDNLVRWANAIEGRDDITFDVEDESLLREFVFELANPLLTKPLTRTRADYWG